MADNTNRFGLNTYSQGDTNWDHTDTVETIDELAIERGAVADRPDSGDYDDELYLATDQQILYRWDAAATDWIVEGVGSETDPLPKVWANEIDADSVNTESASVNGPLDAETATVGHTQSETLGVDEDSGRFRWVSDTDDFQSVIEQFGEVDHGGVVYLTGRVEVDNLGERVRVEGNVPHGGAFGTARGDIAGLVPETGDTLTLSNRATLTYMSLRDIGTLEIDTEASISWCNLRDTTVIIKDDECNFSHNYRANDVTFESGTSAGVAIGNYGPDTAITDEGNNEVIGNT